MRRRQGVLVFLMFVVVGAVALFAAQAPEGSQPPSELQTQTKPAPKQVWSGEQLDNLVAPIALYPDPLLGQILAASTYPLEVVEAYQWLQRNPNLRGKALVDAARQQPWDPSIQALVAVPDALEKLNQDIRWTTDLGNAFLSQQTELMDAVQRMRTRAQEKGRLASTPQQTVTTQEEGGKQAIVIQPSNPQVIYVPAYDPYWVWGPPVYGYYPPLYYPPYGFGFGIGFDLGLCFGGGWGWGGWGWGPSWFGHTVYVNNAFLYHHGYYHGSPGHYYGRPVWSHDPTHRQRVPYANPQIAARYGRGWVSPRSGLQPGPGQFTAGSYYSNRFAGQPAARTLDQGSRSPSAQAQRLQNPPRVWSRNGYSTRPGTSVPQQSRWQQAAPQQYRSAPEQYRGSPRVVPFGTYSRRGFDSPQRYASNPQVYSAPQSQRVWGQPRVQFAAPQHYYGSNPQVYRAPQAQAQRSWSQGPTRFQAPQQYRSAPQMTGPRWGGGSSYSHGGFGSFSGGGGRRH